ncbi:MAG: hypothetical protein EAZ92_08510 [Candidatus Kapaibacterium sp.]|nr:MAG: hypothetical protein EAZ92_08510 [Candidatus Kapabacteria bacterium]
MKRFSNLCIVGIFSVIVGSTLLNSCYAPNNPWNGVVDIGGPVAIIRTFTVVNPTNNAQVAALTAAAGTQLTFVMTYTTLESPVTAVNLYTQIGPSTTASVSRTRVSNVAVNISPSPNRVTQNLTYTIPTTAAPNSRIFLVGSAVTAGGESFSGSGVSGAGTVILTVR